MARVKLKEVIYDYADEAKKNLSEYRRLLRIAKRGIKKIDFAVTGKIKSCRLCVNGNKTVDLPDDYLKWSKVGVLNSAGEIATLKHNESLSTYQSTSPNRIEGFPSGIGGDLTYGWFPYFNYYGDGYWGQNIYGISGNELMKLGDFKVDEDSNVIILNSQFPYSDIILEYLYVPDCDGETYILEQAREALIAWIGWRDIDKRSASPKVSVYDKTQRKRDFYNELNNLRWLVKPFRLEEAVDVSQDAIRLVPKS